MIVRWLGIILPGVLGACGPDLPQLDEASCSECRVELEHVVTLDMSDAASEFMPFTTLLHMPDSSWVAAWSRSMDTCFGLRQTALRQGY